MDEPIASLLFHLSILLPHCELKDTFYVSNDNIREQTLKELGKWLHDNLLLDLDTINEIQAYLLIDRIVQSLKKGEMPETE